MNNSSCLTQSFTTEKIKSSSVKKEKKQSHLSKLVSGWMIVSTLLIASPVLAQKVEQKTLTYGELIQKVDQGEVTKIEIDDAMRIAKVKLKNNEERRVLLLEQNPELYQKIRNKG
ncbi:MAG TPA: ATP-dependent metallopeptidase FtsH/Yme1/Tma family protein, partial [Allocoleopsis sp.]